MLDRLGLAHATLLAREPASRRVRAHRLRAGRAAGAARAGHDINYLARAGVLGMQGPAGRAPQVPGLPARRLRRRAVERHRHPRRAPRARAHRQGQGRRRLDGRGVDGVRAREPRAALRRARPRARRRAADRGARHLRHVRDEGRQVRDARRARAEVLDGVLRRAWASRPTLGGAAAGAAPGDPEGEAARRLRVADARRVGGVRARARLLPRAGARAGRAPGRRAPAGARTSSSRWTRRGAASRSCARRSAERGATYAPPPKQGEHTDAILREAGLDDDGDRRRCAPRAPRRARSSGTPRRTPSRR